MIIVVEYWCDACRWVGESFEERPAPETAPCGLCGGTAEKVISAPKVGTVWGWVTRGKNSKDDKPPGATDTELLADGMSKDHWLKERAAERRKERYMRAKEML